MRKVLVAIGALVLGGALGYVAGSLIPEDTVVTAVKYIVLTGMAVVLLDASRRGWRWWRSGTF